MLIVSCVWFHQFKLQILTLFFCVNFFSSLSFFFVWASWIFAEISDGHAQRGKGLVSTYAESSARRNDVRREEALLQGFWLELLGGYTIVIGKKVLRSSSLKKINLAKRVKLAKDTIKTSPWLEGVDDSRIKVPIQSVLEASDTISVKNTFYIYKFTRPKGVFKNDCFPHFPFPLKL